METAIRACSACAGDYEDPERGECCDDVIEAGETWDGEIGGAEEPGGRIRQRRGGESRE